MRPLRISAISFLNTAPLMWDFQRPEVARDFEIEYTVPSLCAESLRSGTADIGIIPAVTYATIPDLVIIPDVAIAARGAVRSILLISKVPIEQVSTVAADTSSRTSVALCLLLFRKLWGGGRKFTSMAPELGKMLAEYDAALIIGDPALTVNRSAYHVYDLAEEWKRITGKPFVFAFWAVRKQALREMRPGLDLARVFQKSRDHGLEPPALEHLAREWSQKLGITPEDVKGYLTSSIHYRLDAECLEGLQLFLEMCAEYQLIPNAPRLEFLPAAVPARQS